MKKFERDIWFFTFTTAFTALGAVVVYVFLLGNTSRLKEVNWLFGIAFLIFCLWFSFRQAKAIDKEEDNAALARHQELIDAIKNSCKAKSS